MFRLLKSYLQTRDTGNGIEAKEFNRKENRNHGYRRRLCELNIAILVVWFWIGSEVRPSSLILIGFSTFSSLTHMFECIVMVIQYALFSNLLYDQFIVKATSYWHFLKQVEGKVE